MLIRLHGKATHKCDGCRWLYAAELPGLGYVAYCCNQDSLWYLRLSRCVCAEKELAEDEEVAL